MKKTQRGFALLIAVIFMSVMLTFGLQLGSLGYKQQVLSATALQSQYAFYAADAGLECALVADQQKNTFAYPASAPADGTPYKFYCSGVLSSTLTPSWDLTMMVVTSRLSLDGGTHCADVVVYKPNPTTVGAKTSIYSQGYDVSCAVVAAPSGRRFAYRGIKASY